MRHLSLALLFAASCSAHAATYVVEPRHTQGVVRWTHLGFSHPTAQFSRVEGTLVFDPAEPAKAVVRVTIPMAAFSSGVPDLDDDFRSASFFDMIDAVSSGIASTVAVTSRRAYSVRSAGARSAVWPMSTSPQRSSTRR